MSHQSSQHPDAPEAAVGGKGRRPDKPVEIWYRSRRGLLFRDWCRFNRYATEALASEVMDAQRRKMPNFEFEIRARQNRKS